jgi:hypothetical protein
MLKYGSHATNGTAGGRKPVWAAAAKPTEAAIAPSKK